MFWNPRNSATRDKVKKCRIGVCGKVRARVTQTSMYGHAVWFWFSILFHPFISLFAHILFMQKKPSSKHKIIRNSIPHSFSDVSVWCVSSYHPVRKSRKTPPTSLCAAHRRFAAARDPSCFTSRTHRKSRRHIDWWFLKSVVVRTLVFNGTNFISLWCSTGILL